MSRLDRPSPWSELSALVDALLDAPPERRPALIAELSGDDPARRSELERLVEDFDVEPAMLARPAAERFASLLDEPEATLPEVLADRYRLTRELERGGMATVYLARDLRHARDVAIKVVHPAIDLALGSERFLHEIAIVAQLRHPHIVPLFDSGDAGGVLYYVMPFETGPSLRQRLATDGPLPLDDAVLILRDVCDALAYAHQHGIVHRDIKPDNVLLAGRHALVTDFGVAKALASTLESGSPGSDGARSPSTHGLMTAGATLGTPAYMAPEQIARDSRIDHRADIYAVGVLAYELLTGRRPFQGETRRDILSAQVAQAPAPLSAQRPDVPAALAELVMRSLEKRPDDRWQSADAMVDRLERLVVAGRQPAVRSRRMRWAIGAGVLAAVVAAVGLTSLALRRRADASEAWRTRWANARVERLTDFPGSEVDAAISADGQYVAFLADRDSVFDAFVTRVGSGQFRNLTGGKLPELLNEDVRNVGFSGDGSHVWIRVADIASPASVSLVPTTGGTRRPFLPTAVMAAWSPDRSRIAYHETTPTDPIYLADSTGANARKISAAERGVHNHYLSWSPDGRFLYFARGVPPNAMDVWRVPSNGGQAERLTMHNAKVAYPVLLDDQTLLYAATADDGTGPWLYFMDLRARRPERVNMAVEHYTSIAAAADVPGRPRRLVATVSNPSMKLWTVAIADTVVPEPSVGRVTLPTARGAAPRFAPDGSLLYLASRGGADGVWRLSEADTSELWQPGEGAAAGAVAVSPDGRRMCVPVRRQGRTTLWCMSASGTDAKAVTGSLDVSGSPSWSPDGRWLAVAANDGVGVRLFKVPADGGAPVRLVDSVASNPVWSPNGNFILYSGTPRARSAPVQAVTPDGERYTLPGPALLVDRVGDSYRFLSGGNALVAKLGGFRHQDFWRIDLASGQRRRLTALAPGESLHRFDVSPDGRRIVFERIRENSDIALITLPP
jgi:Tol biopolymer transport system component